MPGDAISRNAFDCPLPRRHTHRPALLRFRSQSILSFLTEDSDAHRCGREVVHRWNYFRNYFLRFGERAAMGSKILFRNALALHRPVPRRPHRGHLRRAAPAQRFLHGRRQRRRLEDHRFRQHLESDFRRPAYWFRWRARRGSFRSEHHLRRQWRRSTTPGSRDRRWRLQIHRRRKNLDAFAKPPRRPANHRDPHRPERSQPRFRRRRRTSLRPERRARRLPFQRRRTNFPEGSLQGRKHRRRRSRFRSHKSANNLRGIVGRSCCAVGDPQRRILHQRRQRHFQIHRWRKQLAPAHQRTSHGRRWSGPHRRCRLAQRAEPRLRHGGSKEKWRCLPFR